MLPIAHIASALFVTRVTGLDRGPAPAVMGALVPDAIDKTLAWVLGITQSARHAAHTPLAAALLTLPAIPVVGRRAALGFGAAYLTHLLGDLWDHGHVPWLYPFKRYEVSSRRWDVRINRGDIALELAGAAYLLLVAKGVLRQGSS